MSSFSRSERDTMRAVRSLCHAGLDAEALRLRLGDRLREALGAQASCVMDLDPVLSFPVHAVEHGWPADAREPLAAVLMTTRAADPRAHVERRSGAVAADTLVTGALADDPYFREHVLAFGYRHEIQVPCLSMDRGRAFLCFTRTDARGAFTPGHHRLLDAVATQIGAAIHAASLRQRADDTLASEVGMLTLDAEGRVELANAAGERWMRRATSPGRQYLLALRVFTSLARRLRDDDPRTVPELALFDPDTGAPTVLRAEHLVGADGRPRLLVLVQPGRLVDHPQALVSLGLTPRETEVAIAIARGRSAKEIAVSLSCSVHTVDDHTRRVFDKLGVSGRGAVALRLLGA